MTTREERKLAAKRLELQQLDLEVEQNPSEEKKLQIGILELEIQILDPACPLDKNLLLANQVEKEKRLNQLHTNSTGGSGEKKVTVIFPGLKKNEDPTEKEVSFSNEKEYVTFCKSERGNLDKDNVIMRFKDLVNGGVYTMGGGWRDAELDGRCRSKADDKVLEVECGLATVHACGEPAHRHSGVIFTDTQGNPTMELDNVVVHSHKEGVPNATAYVVKCAYSPQVSEVDILLKKVEKFKKLAHTHEHFGNCTTFVPVLGGRNWSENTLKECFKMKVSTVTPNGLGYTMTRAFRAVARRVPK